jgi:hypothetical protein
VAEPPTTTQAFDVDFVKQKLITLQRERAYGHVHTEFEDGVMQFVRVSITFWPPSRKKIKKILDKPKSSPA